MQTVHPLTSPTVTIHRASPTTPPHSQSMIAQSPFAGGVWPSMGGDYLSAIPRNFQDPRYHKRASSGSSIQSTGPDSPLDQANIYNPRIATSETNYSPSRYDFEYAPQTAKTTHSMPDTIMYPGNAQFSGIDMRRIHSSGHDDRASYGAPQSVSTMSHHNSPATPQTWEDPYSDEKHFAGNFPSAAFQQSMQDVFPDQSQQIHFNNMAKMNSHRHTLQEQFSKSQQQHLRTASPTSNPREKSPFKATSSMMRPVQRPQQQMPQLQKERTSISPKELMLDDHDVEDNQPSLFADRASFQRQSSGLSNFYTPSFQQESSMQIPQHYPFVGQNSSQNIPESTPEFPAHMLSMESTGDEGPSEPSSQQSMYRSQPRLEVSRPADTSSDAGTYSCTYHGCPQRFDSPAKLQKHKREGHRQHDSNGPTNPSLKNSQAGPHRCDRINPSTGKPCNSVFSRPYDLTRHEDTIHNARKLKVRCHLCTEEKTFSRNDALTRHMRVVHPDVDWVGKQKKRSHK